MKDVFLMDASTILGHPSLSILNANLHLFFHPFSCYICGIYSYSVNMQTAMEHNAQVMLYTLLMSDRYVHSSSLLYILISNTKKTVFQCSYLCNSCICRYDESVDSGFLYYLHTDQTQVQQYGFFLFILRLFYVVEVDHNLCRELLFEDLTWQA